MNLVYDIYSILQKCGSKSNLILHISNIVDTIVACRVHLNNVGCNTRVDTATCFTAITGIAVLRILTVNSLGKYFGTAGFTRTTRSTEQISVGKSIISNLVFEYIGYAVLTANIIKITRTPFSI